MVDPLVHDTKYWSVMFPLTSIKSVVFSMSPFLKLLYGVKIIYCSILLFHRIIYFYVIFYNRSEAKGIDK